MHSPQRTGNTPLASPLLPRRDGQAAQTGRETAEKTTCQITELTRLFRYHHNSIGDGYAEPVHNSG